MATFSIAERQEDRLDKGRGPVTPEALQSKRSKMVFNCPENNGED